MANLTRTVPGPPLHARTEADRLRRRAERRAARRRAVIYPLVAVVAVVVWRRWAVTGVVDGAAAVALVAAAGALLWSRVLSSGENGAAVRWSVGAGAEEQTAELLDRWVASPAGRARSAKVFHDVRIPGRSENVDHVVVDRSGLAVIETKRWTGDVVVGRHVRVTGHLGGARRQRRERRDGAVTQTVRLCGAVGRMLDSSADVGQSRPAGFVCIHGAAVRPAWWRRRSVLDGVELGGPDDLLRWLRRRRRCLSARQAAALQRAMVARLERAPSR